MLAGGVSSAISRVPTIGVHDRRSVKNGLAPRDRFFMPAALVALLGK